MFQNFSAGHLCDPAANSPKLCFVELSKPVISPKFRNNGTYDGVHKSCQSANRPAKLPNGSALNAVLEPSSNGAWST